MAFQLKANEGVGAGITRNVRREIEKALHHLDVKGNPHQSDARANDAVHEVRKCFKRVRAALRLLREDLGDDAYHEYNLCFRDAARPLSEIRDAKMLVESLDKLTQHSADPSEPGEVAKIRDALLAEQEEVMRGVLTRDRAFMAVEEIARRALARTEWKIERDGWAALEGGLRRVYRAGHRALRLAVEDPSMANLHEWRKQAKYLWHQLQLLEPAWVGCEKELGDQVHKLSQLLGEDHDLAVLRQTLSARPLTYGGHRALKGVFGAVDRQRKELERQAFALGQQFYKDSPRVFTSRVEAYWRAWTAKVEGTRAGAGSHSAQGLSRVLPKP
jgi:CHAD domain-containing protein